MSSKGLVPGSGRGKKKKKGLVYAMLRGDPLKQVYI